MDVQRLQVLVVGTDDGVIDAVRGILTDASMGADLVHAEDAAAARRVLFDDEVEAVDGPDLVLIDTDTVGDPVGGLLEPLAKDGELARLPVVAMSSDPDQAAAELTEQRLHDVIAKPPQPDELLRLVWYFNEA